jgi:hypothetical protein
LAVIDCISGSWIGAGSVARTAAQIDGPILMLPTSTIDHSGIDGRLLQVLLAVFQEHSVTRAAARLTSRSWR